jgi:hypothetical protein
MEGFPSQMEGNPSPAEGFPNAFFLVFNSLPEIGAFSSLASRAFWSILVSQASALDAEASPAAPRLLSRGFSTVNHGIRPLARKCRFSELSAAEAKTVSAEMEAPQPRSAALDGS